MVVVEIVEMALIQWVYASAEAVPFSPAELDELLLRARSRNEAGEITGLLLYHEGSFLQILEGEEHQVKATIGRIEQDKRHQDVRLIFRGQIEERNFGEWRMGFCRPVNAEDIPGFVDLFRSMSTNDLDLEANAKRVEKLIDGFKEGRWRQSVAA